MSEAALAAKKQGNDLFATERWTEAIEQWAQAIKLCDASADRELISILYSNTAQARIEQGKPQFAEAEAAARMALKFNPKNEKAELRLQIATGVVDINGNPTTNDMKTSKAAAAQSAAAASTPANRPLNNRRPAPSQWVPRTSGNHPLFVRPRAALTAEQRAENPPPLTEELLDRNKIFAHFRSKIVPSLMRPKKKNSDDVCKFLAPSFPTWILDPDFFCATFYQGSINPMFLRNMGIGGRQRETDLRWEALRELCGVVSSGDSGEKKLPASEMLPKFRACGYKIKETRKNPAPPSNKPLSMSEVLGSGLVEADENFPVERLPPTVQRCDRCKKILDVDHPPECVCSTPYCSLECYKADASAHAQQCDAIRDNQLLESSMTQQYWLLVASGHIFNQFVA